MVGKGYGLCRSRNTKLYIITVYMFQVSFYCEIHSYDPLRGSFKYQVRYVDISFGVFNFSEYNRQNNPLQCQALITFLLFKGCVCPPRQSGTGFWSIGCHRYIIQKEGLFKSLLFPSIVQRNLKDVREYFVFSTFTWPYKWGYLEKSSHLLVVDFSVRL